MEIKFLWNGIKVDGKFIKCAYSLTDTSIELYAESYFDDLPKIDNADPKNDSDSRIDYFERDSITIDRGNKYYADVINCTIEAIKKRIETLKKRISKKPSMSKYYGNLIKDKKEEIKFLKKLI